MSAKLPIIYSQILGDNNTSLTYFSSKIYSVFRIVSLVALAAFWNILLAKRAATVVFYLKEKVTLFQAKTFG
jgi:hypothetical protein